MNKNAKPINPIQPVLSKNVIKEHLEVLLENGEVAFGKLKSKLKSTSHPDVEAWFLIDDMYEIIRDDFESVRDKILANFTTPNYGNTKKQN